MSQLFVPPTDFDQTKRIRRHQWCVDGAHALSWVLPTPQAERFAKAAGYHGARNRGKSRRSTVETGTYPQKQKPLRQDPILVPLSLEVILPPAPPKAWAKPFSLALPGRKQSEMQISVSVRFGTHGVPY